ncbi:MAG TPA: hypothetical protein VGV60_18515 [Candidatus Polarisedimenticolia bacterium]|jgi:hypothetical protein|nr:hypothetical protein [Candidatus Polarisedimenticolia bacterium]
MKTSSRPNSRTTRSLIALALVLGVASSAAAFARGYMTAGFLGKKSRPMTVALLLPHAEFVKEKVIMTDQMVQESAALENEGFAALKAMLAAKGYKVRAVTSQELGRSAALGALARKMNDRYDEEWSRIVRRPKQVRQHRYTAGEAAVKLCAFLKVDGVALARIQAVGVSKGKATMRAIFGSTSAAPRSFARMDLTVFEGRQGFAEGYFSGYENTSYSQLTKKAALVMGQVSENLLRKYPESSEVRIVEESETTEVKDSDSAGADPVGEFEALLDRHPSSNHPKTGSQPKSSD